jgi:UDP-N-acetylglucosamine diphosphorylase / glucose-1-phosphate thymidylyltransferase / UDP-N-acetylgalactosamine diphosphorylase / glucosamine-1-phosphate N-acetyltransferase / galactosamine-1-phosphate N-acetyltransferase
MSELSIVVFEDEKVTQLYPAAVGRPACLISCGSYRLADILGALGHVSLLVRPHLGATLEADGYRLGWPTTTGRVLLVNARLVPNIDLLAELDRWLALGRVGVVANGNQVIAAIADSTALPTNPNLSPHELQRVLLALPKLDGATPWPMLDYPHDIVRFHLTSLKRNLEHRLKHGAYEQREDGLFVAKGAKLGPYMVADTANGPVLIDEQANVGPYVYLRGPVYIGPHSRVTEQAAIKDSVSLGHTTKTGGEVEGAILEPYTNKQHHGFLGHSYLGSWVNLGAGTCNSDLKNTYGQVNMDYQGQKVATGMQFIGCIVGDYSKSAINTGIFTGKTVGVCSMLYGFVTTNVSSFTNYARSFGQVTELPVEVMVQTQARMFLRRHVQQRPCDIKLLYDMYDLTRNERQIAGEPLSL